MAAPGQDQKSIALYERFVAETSAIPGVQAAAVSSSMPLGFVLMFPFTVEGLEARAGDVPQANYSAVSPNYFAPWAFRSLWARIHRA
ncbi:MAG: hypothetical protein WKF84_09150 [Pyrinomonadaceae bacterium]